MDGKDFESLLKILAKLLTSLLLRSVLFLQCLMQDALVLAFRTSLGTFLGLNVLPKSCQGGGPGIFEMWLLCRESRNVPVVPRAGWLRAGLCPHGHRVHGCSPENP